MNDLIFFQFSGDSTDTKRKILCFVARRNDDGKFVQVYEFDLRIRIWIKDDPKNGDFPIFGRS